MATTSLWAIHERLDHVLDYASDDEKTMDTVLKYATDDNKTETKEYVSCINCSSAGAFKSMMRTKEIFHTESNILGYHGYQSFKKGEGTAEQIHAIGIQTAKELWGDRFEIVVATHLDKDHLHNHFVINSTSFVDGKMFHHSKKDIYKFRDVSDKYCKEYGLSIVDNPIGKGKKRNSYQAMKSYIKEIKNDMDKIIPNAFIEKYFFNDMRLEGYEFQYKDGEYFILHPHCNQPIPMKMLGHKYQIDEIKQRILDEYKDRNNKGSMKLSDFKTYYFLYKQKKLKGFQYYYIQWMVMVGVLPEKRIKQHLSKEIRQECKKLDRISDEIILLCEHNITNLDELNEYKVVIQMQYDNLIKERKIFYYQRKVATIDEKDKYSKQAKSLTPQIKKLRYTLKCLNEIESRSTRLIEQSIELEQNKERKKERERH